MSEERENDSSVTTAGSTNDFEKRFTIDTYDIKTKTNHDISIVLMGEAVASLTNLAMKNRISSLMTLEVYLQKCLTENKRHGISLEMLDELYEHQNETSRLFENCRELIDKINESLIE